MTSSDGRSTRWDEHRARQRTALTQSTLRAIRRHGAGVGMDEIAAEANTSKTVIYRHFGDRSGLYAAVTAWVQNYILKGLEPAFAQATSSDLVALVRDLTDAYLALVERDPEIYRFVVNPGDVAGATATLVDAFVGTIGDRLGVAFAAHLPENAQARATVWGHGVAGCIRAVADQWTSEPAPRPRGAVVADVTALVAPALAALTVPSPPLVTVT